MVVTERPCAGEHEVRRGIPCSTKEVVCAKPCGRLAECGAHYCTRSCHSSQCVLNEGEGAEERRAEDAARTAAVGAYLSAADEAIGAILLSPVPPELSADALTICSELFDPTTSAAGFFRSTDAWDSVPESGADAQLLRAALSPSSTDEAALLRALPVLASAALIRIPSVEDATARVRETALRLRETVFGPLRPACNAPCGRPRGACAHPCPARCHPGSMCPRDKPCSSRVERRCACGRLAAFVSCRGAAAPSPLDCDALCASTARASALLDAPALASGAAPLPRSPFSDALLSWSIDNPEVASRVEKAMRVLVTESSAGAGANLPPMPSTHRAAVHQLAEVFGLNSLSGGVEPKRFVRISRRAAGAASVNGPKLGTAAATAPASSPTANGSQGTSLVSSIGTEIEPGVFILPAISLTEAARAHAARISRALAGRGAGGRTITLGLGSADNGAAGGHPGALHPSEPLARDMDSRDVGRILHLTRVKRTLLEMTVRDLLRSTGGDVAASFKPWRRMDDASSLLYFDSPARATRAREAWESLRARGAIAEVVGANAILRVWGVGAEALMEERDRESKGLLRPPGPLFPAPALRAAPAKAASEAPARTANHRFAALADDDDSAPPDASPTEDSGWPDDVPPPGLGADRADAAGGEFDAPPGLFARSASDAHGSPEEQLELALRLSMM